MPKSFTFVVADPHPIVRLGVISVLRKLGGKAIEAQDGAEAVRLTARHKPALAILEIFLDRCSGFVAANQIIHGKTATRVLMFTEDSSAQQLERAAAVGVHGYLGKDQPEPTALLGKAVTELLQGRTWFDERVAKHMEQYSRIPGYPRKEALSEREMEVFYLIVTSHSNKEVSEQLEMSVKTVEAHRANLMRKLGENDLAGLTRVAAKTGYLKTR